MNIVICIPVSPPKPQEAICGNTKWYLTLFSLCSGTCFIGFYIWSSDIKRCSDDWSIVLIEIIASLGSCSEISGSGTVIASTKHVSPAFLSILQIWGQWFTFLQRYRCITSSLDAMRMLFPSNDTTEIMWPTPVIPTMTTCTPSPQNKATFTIV